MRIRQCGLALFFVTMGLGSQSVRAADDDATVFGTLPQFASATLSPDGKYIAAIQPLGGHEGLRFFPITEAGVQPAKRTLSLADGIVQSIHWTNENQLLVEVTSEVKYAETLGYKRIQMILSPDGNDPKSLSDKDEQLLSHIPGSGWVAGADGKPKGFLSGGDSKYYLYRMIGEFERPTRVTELSQQEFDHAAMISLSEDNKNFFLLSRHNTNTLGLYAVDAQTG